MHVVVVWLFVRVESHTNFHFVDIGRHVTDLDSWKFLGLLGVCSAVNAAMSSLHLRLVTEPELLLRFLYDFDVAVVRLLGVDGAAVGARYQSLLFAGGKYIDRLTA